MTTFSDIKQDLRRVFQDAVSLYRIKTAKTVEDKVAHTREMMQRSVIMMKDKERPECQDGAAVRAVKCLQAMSLRTEAQPALRQQVIRDMCELMPTVRNVMYYQTLVLTGHLTEAAKCASPEMQGLALSTTRKVMGNEHADKMQAVFRAENQVASARAKIKPLGK